MVEMVVADDDGLDLLAGHEPVGGIDPGKGLRFAAIGLEHHQPVGELDHRPAGGAHAHVPHAVGDFGDLRLRPGRWQPPAAGSGNAGSSAAATSTR